MGVGRFFNYSGTFLVLAMVTYVVLDMNQAVNYERSNTNRYLNKIGVGPYVNTAIRALNSNQFYRQTVYPAYAKFIDSARYYTQDARRILAINVDKAAQHGRKFGLALVQFVEEVVLPKLVHCKNCLAAFYQKNVVPLCAQVQEKILSLVATLEKNDVYYKVHEAVVNFFMASRKQALNAVEWINKNVQQIMS